MSAINPKACLIAALSFLLATFPSSAQETALKKLTTEANNFYRQAKYAQAVHAGEDALRVAEKTYGSSHREVATALGNLAEYQRASGNYTEAETLQKRALLLDQKLLGAEHPDVAVDLNNLAMLYDSLGRYVEAEPLYNQALAIDQHTLGPDAPDVAVDLNNLAEAYRAQGKLSEAESFYRRALAIWMKQPSQNPRAIATVLSNLGALTATQGKFAEAEQLLSQALEKWHQAVRVNHPAIASTLRALGAVQVSLHEYKKAESSFSQALSIDEKAQTKNSNQQVAKDLTNLGLVLFQQRKYDAAEERFRRALDLDETNYGKEHLIVASDANNLAEVYRAEGKYRAAEPLYRRAALIDEKLLGPDHPDLANDLNNLGALYFSEGRYAAAEPVLKRALAIKQDALGPNDRRLLQILDNYAIALRALNRNAEAAAIDARVKEIRAKSPRAMNESKLRKLLHDARVGRVSTDHVVKQLKSLAIHDLDFARVDGHRSLRKGFPEVIYCEGKTPAQVVKIARTILRHNDNLLATRSSKETFRTVKRAFPKATYHDAARAVTVVRKPLPKRGGTIAVLCAGTTDIPVAEEAVITADIMGNRVKRYYDVGVAGIHRLLALNEELLDASVLIVVAGMEGALPSVVAGLVDKPVIAVPTSVGYGASFGGVAALLAMLNSCASGVTVVNIDNGFGAGYAASLINSLG